MPPAAGSTRYTATRQVVAEQGWSGRLRSPSAHRRSTSRTATNGNRTAPLTDIKTTIYGLKSDGKDFPTCSMAKIVAAAKRHGVPEEALVASGSITAILGPVASQSSSAPGQLPCDPLLDVWNAGRGRSCSSSSTGPPHVRRRCDHDRHASGRSPAPSRRRQEPRAGHPDPDDVSFPIAGVEGSLTSETLNWKKHDTKLKNGKTVALRPSVACKSGKRPYSVAFTAEPSAGAAEVTQTVTGTPKCS